jgi:hypothetical protein
MVMGTIGSWIRRRGALVAFAAGALLTLLAVAVVAYLVLADQRRSARVLGVALTQALKREVEIERVTDLGPSRVELRGLRLSAKAGWPADVKVESVEASGPLTAAARGQAAPVRVVVNRPTVTPAAGGGGAVDVEGLRQTLTSLLGSAALLDVAVVGGVIKVPGSATGDLTFDASLHKGSAEARGELVLRSPTDSRLSIGLSARTEGDTVRVDLAGRGALDPLAPWLPAALIRTTHASAVDLRTQIGLSPGDRAAGHASVRLGDLLALESAIAVQDRTLRFRDVRATADLALAATVAGLQGPVMGRAEVADGAVTWVPERGGWPEAQITLHFLDAALPASAAGVDVRTKGVEARLTLEPHDKGLSARGELRGDRVEVAGLALEPVASPLRIDLDPGGSVSRVELTGLTAQVLGSPVKGTIAYDFTRGRADARVEMGLARLDALARSLGGDWLGPSDELRAGSVRAVVTGLDPRGWSDGSVDTQVSGLAFRQPAGEIAVDRARLQATVKSGGANVGLDAERVRGSHPFFQGLLAHLQGSGDVARDGGGASLVRASLVARDEQGREMFQADMGRGTPSPAAPVRLTLKAPALERLVPLWPSIPRQVVGSGTAELESPDLGFSTYAGHVTLAVASAELLDGRLSVRDLSADVPLRRGGGSPTAGAATAGSLQMAEVVGYGAVAYDVTGRPGAVDGRLTVTDLRYGLYSGRGGGTIELEPAAAGPIVRAHLTGEGVRIEEFMAAYGIRGGTMTGLLRYDLKMSLGGGPRLAADGEFLVPEGGTVTIELLDRLLKYADADPTGVVKSALGNLRAFDYKLAKAAVRTASDDLRVSLSLHGRERFGIFPPRVKEINVNDMPISFLARQFPGQ